MKKQEENKRVQVSLAQIGNYVLENILQLTEKPIQGKPFIEYGSRNLYPQYLFNLYTDSPTLHSIIEGVGDYVVGDGVNVNDTILQLQINRKGDSMEDLVRWISIDYAIYGGFAINVVRNKIGGIAELYYLDFKNIRADRDREIYYYSTDWSKYRVDYSQYPRFDINGTDGNSVYYYSNSNNSTYPRPVWQGSVVSAEIEKEIGKYHLNSLKNGLTSNVIVNLNNGQPSDEAREEIEEAFNEKFCGSENAARPILSFNADKEHGVEVVKIDADNFVERYNALSKWSKEELFTAFRAHPSLFGISTEGSSINKEDYNQCYKLFAKTVITPIQKKIVNAINFIYNKNIIEIEPFTLDFSEEATNDETIEE